MLAWSPVVPSGDTGWALYLPHFHRCDRLMIAGVPGFLGCCLCSNGERYTVQANINTTNQPFGDAWGVRPCAKDDCPPYDMTPFNPWNSYQTSWKALLRPMSPGGNYTIQANCTGCDANHSSISITNVTFGDVGCMEAFFSVLKPVF